MTNPVQLAGRQEPVGLGKSEILFPSPFALFKELAPGVIHEGKLKGGCLNDNGTDLFKHGGGRTLDRC